MAKPIKGSNVNPKDQGAKPKSNQGNKTHKKSGSGNRSSRGRAPKGTQSRKDSDDPRVNYDNTRESKFDKDMKSPGHNDIAWYAKNPELLRSAGSIGFSNVTGSKIPFTVNNSVPGVCAISWAPSLGGDNLTAINQAKESIYSYVTHANSRNYKYDPSDLTIMMLAGMNVFTGIAYLVKAYGVMKSYSAVNLYTPQVIIRSMGFDFNDLQKNLSKMWFDINNLIAMSTQIWIPSTMPVLNRWMWMSQDVYFDSTNPKAQIYHYVPQTLWMLKNEFGSSGSGFYLVPLEFIPPKTTTGKTELFSPGSIATDPKNPKLYTWDEAYTAIATMLDALVYCPDRGIIMGDILKAYGPDQIYALNEIPVDFRLEYKWNTEVQAQFENLTLTGHEYTMGIAGGTSFYTNYFPPIKGRAYGTYNAGASASAWRGVPPLPKDLVLNFHMDGQPSPEAIMLATRLMNCGTKLTRSQCWSKDANGSWALSTQWIWTPGTTGTEVCYSATYYSYNYTNNPIPTISYTRMVSVNDTDTLLTSQLFEWCAFDWAPWLYTVPSSEYTVGNGPVPSDSAFGDWDNYTIVDQSELNKLHETALLSEFGVPTM